MRKVLLFNMISLDGFFAAPNHDISWHQTDEEFNTFAHEQLINDAETILFGRVTYELMASYWPTSFAMETDPIIADKMNRSPKVVFSRTLQSVAWHNTRLASDAVAEITALKQQPGKDMIILGSANLAASLIPLGLIDELRLMVNPVVLGRGTPLFQGVAEPLKLELLRTKTFHNGNVLLFYQPARQP